MARNETSRLKITIDIDKATGKILQFNQTLGNTEKKVKQTGGAMSQLATQTNAAGQSAAASAVNFQTFSMGLLNLSTSAVQTYTSISNLARAQNRAEMSIIAVARAEDLLANKQERANAMVQSGTAGGQKYVNILREIETAEADLLVKKDKMKIEQDAVNDVYMLFGANIANVAISSMQTIAVMDKNQIILTKAKTVAQRLSNLSIFNASKASLAHTAVMYKSATANLVATTTTTKLTFAVKRLTLATKAFVTSNPILIAAMAAAGAALVIYESNFLGVKDAIHGTTEETKSFKEGLDEARAGVEGLDGSMKDLDSTAKFKLPESIGEARAALVRYRDEMDQDIVSAINLAAANKAVASSIDEVQKKTTNNQSLNFLLGSGIIPTAAAEEMPISSLGYVPPIQSTPSTRFKYKLNDFGHTIKVPMTTAEVAAEDNAADRAAYLASLPEIPFFTMNNEYSKWYRSQEKRSDIHAWQTTNRLDDMPQHLRDEEFAAYSVGLTLKQYLDKEADGTLEKYIELYEKTQYGEYITRYASDPAFRQSISDQKRLEQSLRKYETPLDYTAEQAKIAGDREQAEIDKKKRAAPAERLLLSKLANKIYQEQFGSFYSPSGIGTGFNPKQYTNLVRQQAAQQGIDMSKFENVIMNGINLSTGEEVKTLREKAGYEYPDKPKMEDLVKGMIGRTSGVYKKDEMSDVMKMMLSKGTPDFDYNPMEERLAVMAEFGVDVGMAGGREEAIRMRTMQNLLGIRDKAISPFLVRPNQTYLSSGETIQYGVDQFGNRTIETIGGKRNIDMSAYEKLRLGVITEEEFEYINQATSAFASSAISQAQQYADSILNKPAEDDPHGQFQTQDSPAANQAAEGRAQWLGRMTWYKEQNRNYTVSRGGSGHSIVNHYVRNAVNDEDRQAMTNLANSHDQQVREYGEEAFERGKDLDILWLRKQTENQAKALSSSISMRVTAERATALEFGNQLGISQNEALTILRDKSQGEQTLNDMLAYQMRLDAMSNGVVS